MKIKILFLLLFIGNLCYSQDNVSVGILTCGTGDDIYAIFGHSAIRIRDKDKRIDQIYDFGTFDFSTPNFEYEFLQGKSKCNLTRRKAKLFIQHYTSQNRLIVEQKLNLPDSIKSKLIKRLNDLYKPENRTNSYSFLKSNCSTDIRDLLTFGGVEFSNYHLKKTSRDLINDCLDEKEWSRLLINTISGFKIDKRTDRFQSMFLPEHLKSGINSAQLNNINIVKSEKNLNRIKSSTKSILSKFFCPLYIFSILLLTYCLRFQKSIEFILIPLIGFSGLVITAICVLTGHEEFQYNLNILWCNPLYLFYPLLSPKGSMNKIITIVISLSLIICVIIWLVGFQKFDVALIPIMIMLTLVNYKRLKNNIGFPKKFISQNV